jgi:DNA-binding NarL/FixJ family response regulator
MKVMEKLPVRVVLVEDDPDTRQRFVEMISSQADMLLVCASPNAQQALDYIQFNEVDVLLTDLGLPDRSGVEVIRACAARWPHCDIMVITVFGDESHVLTSIEAGATGYVLKDVVAVELAEHVRDLRAGGSPISPMIARQLLKRYQQPSAEIEAASVVGLAAGAKDDVLSSREAEVLGYIAKGFSFGEIASFLNISVHTVMTHVKRIYKKLAVHSRGEAVFEARQLGLLKL